ncbi:DUF2971 domain-containing protein [Imbroritus primus]|uniref:DUF2971 domain-containing protein n=1 Tax=Imbroritus primus TaxID=3058603 RepID=UPI003D160F26
MNREFKNTGVFCTSKDNTHPLMWSHYADNHRGVCIGFSALMPPLALAQPVIYSPTRPVLKFGNNPDEISKALCHKADFWQYEREYRVISLPNASGDLSEFSRDPKFDFETVRFIHECRGPGLFRIPKEVIQSLCFGCKTAPSEIEEVSSIAKLHLPHIELWRAKMVHDRYELHIERID